MGTHSDGKPVQVGGFKGTYWEKKSQREAQGAADKDAESQEDDASS